VPVLPFLNGEQLFNMDSLVTPSMVDLLCVTEQFVVGESTSPSNLTNKKYKSATNEFSDVVCPSDLCRAQFFCDQSPPVSSSGEQGEPLGSMVSAADHSEELQKLCHLNTSSSVNLSAFVDDMSKGKCRQTDFVLKVKTIGYRPIFIIIALE